MSTAHKGSILPIKDVIIPVPDGGIYFPFDYHAGSSQLLMPNAGGVYTIRPDGRYGGAIAIDEATTNIAQHTDYSDKTYGLKYDVGGWGGDDADVYYYANGGIGNLPYKKLIKLAGGTGGSFNDDHGPITIEASKAYAVSCWMKANRSVTVDGYALSLNRTADNAYRVGPSINLTTEWKRVSWIYNAGAGDAGTYVARQIIYIDDNLPLEIYWCGFQVEQKAFPTSYVDGSRSDGIVRYNPSILNLSNGTIAMWITPEKALSGTANIFLEANAGSSNVNQIQMWQEGSAWKCGVIGNGEAGGPATRGETIDTFPANVPIFVALTWENVNSGSANAKVAFYKNGQYVHGRSNATINLLPLTLFALGSRATGASYNANSLIDDLIILPYAASADEVVSWYCKDRPFYDPYDYTLLAR